MKKKLVLLMLAGMCLCATACGSSDTTAENTQVTEETNETTEAVETETTETETAEATETEATEATETETAEATETETAEATETEATEATETETTEGTDAETTEEAKIDEAKLEEMLTATIDWIAIQYLEAENPNVSGLTVAQAVPMAVHAVGATPETFESNENFDLIIPAATLEETMKNLFGTSYDTAEYTPVESDRVKKAEDGSLSYTIGEWGLAVPKFSVESIEKDTATDGFIATVNYYTYDEETKTDSATEYTARYTLTPNAESAYGFVITNMVGEKQ
ncbi:MAG: hypothetical protein IJA36_04625 [Lachnospiraceae bacterium]|nr:hypothetical protein [Lachnospiraceae bacterium]